MKLNKLNILAAFLHMTEYNDEIKSLWLKKKMRYFNMWFIHSVVYFLSCKITMDRHITAQYE